MVALVKLNYLLEHSQKGNLLVQESAYHTRISKMKTLVALRQIKRVNNLRE
jgi:hypothetical protein